MIKKNYFIVLYILLILLAVYLKLFIGNKIFSEFDDSGVLSIHQTMYQDREISLKFMDDYEINFILEKEYFSNNALSNPLLFATYIGYNWSYPPGQFIFTSLLISELDTYRLKMIKGRALSGLYSLFSIVFLFLICTQLNISQFTKLFILFWFTLVLNQNLYSFHMGPYMMHVLAWLVVVYMYLKNKSNPNKLIKLLPIFFGSIYFSYLNIFPLIFILLDFIRLNSDELINHLKKNFFYIFVSSLLLLPLLIFIKPNLADSGSLNDGLSFIQILKSLRSSIAISSNDVINSILLTSLVIVTIFGMFMNVRNFFKDNNSRTFVYQALFFMGPIFLWLILGLMGAIIVQESRHVLVWTASMLIVPGVLLERNTMTLQSNILYQSVMIFFISIIIFLGSYSNYKTFEKKIDIVDYNFLKNISQEIVLVYGGSIAPLSYLKSIGSNNVYYIENKSFKNSNLLKDLYNECEKEFFLVSQYSKLEDYLRNEKNQILVNMQYDILLEKETNEFMTYNNKFNVTTPNNFYIYKILDRCK